VFGTTAETMQLQLQTWPEVDAYLRTSRGIIMPIGSSEQHGPIGHKQHDREQ
jgi:creatinine amidohydrolase/Fe(II)-dependent formamide hydrolase-like protein